MGKRVSVFVCGVQKGGTTSLYSYFAAHPQLSAPKEKETHFFSNEKIKWDAPDYSKLEAWYQKKNRGRLRFDITPAYCFWPPAFARIKAYNPDAKLIFLFRDPYDRAWSNWCMQYARGIETLPFAEAIRDGRKRLDDLPELAKERRFFSYVERGYYAQQVRRALEHFPADQMLFLRSIDLLKRHEATLAKIADFLKIQDFPQSGIIRAHKRPKIKYPSVRTEEDRQLIADLLRDEMTDFAALTGLDLYAEIDTVKNEQAHTSGGETQLSRADAVHAT